MMDYQEEIERLKREVAKLRADVVQINHPQKWIFFASPGNDPDNPGLDEYVPALQPAGFIGWTHENVGNRKVDDGADAMQMVSDPIATVGDEEIGLVPYMQFLIAPGKFGYVRMFPPPAPACPGTNVVTLGDDAEGDDTPDTTAFDFLGADTNAGTVELWIETRNVYDSSGAEKLNGYKRKLTFTCQGGVLNLTAISAESGYEVDAPEACP